MFFSVLLCLISAQNSRKEWKWTERSFFRMEKNVTYRTEKNGVPNPADSAWYMNVVYRTYIYESIEEL